MNEAAAINNIGPTVLNKGRAAFSPAFITITITAAAPAVDAEAQNHFLGLSEICGL